MIDNVVRKDFVSQVTLLTVRILAVALVPSGGPTMRHAEAVLLGFMRERGYRSGTLLLAPGVDPDMTRGHQAELASEGIGPVRAESEDLEQEARAMLARHVAFARDLAASD